MKTDAEVCFIDYLSERKVLELRGEVDEHVKDSHCSLAWWIRLYCAKFQKDFEQVLDNFLRVATKDILEYDLDSNGVRTRIKVTVWHFGSSKKQ
ncbi:MAG: hypothetical protein ABL925_17945 [Methylococcales bacterium]